MFAFDHSKSMLQNYKELLKKNVKAARMFLLLNNYCVILRPISG